MSYTVNSKSSDESIAKATRAGSLSSSLAYLRDRVLPERIGLGILMAQAVI